jgi:hypothetical protein
MTTVPVTVPVQSSALTAEVVTRRSIRLHDEPSGSRSGHVG